MEDDIKHLVDDGALAGLKAHGLEGQLEWAKVEEGQTSPVLFRRGVGLLRRPSRGRCGPGAARWGSRGAASRRRRDRCGGRRAGNGGGHVRRCGPSVARARRGGGLGGRGHSCRRTPRGWALADMTSPALGAREAALAFGGVAEVE